MHSGKRWSHKTSNKVLNRASILPKISFLVRRNVDFDLSIHFWIFYIDVTLTCELLSRKNWELLSDIILYTIIQIISDDLFNHKLSTKRLFDLYLL